VTDDDDDDYVASLLQTEFCLERIFYIFNCMRCSTYETAGRVFTCPPLLFDRHASSGEIMNLYLRRCWFWGLGWTLQ